MLGIKTKKSAGVPVTAPVHRLISRGNDARGIGDWSTAAQRYQSALELEPGLHHIWVQLGHAFSEMGAYQQAEGAYREAIGRGAGAGDVHLFLAHMFKRAGDSATSAGHYLEAARDGNEDALVELERRLAPMIPISRPLLERVVTSDRSGLPSVVRVDEVAAGLRSIAAADLDPRIRQIVGDLADSVRVVAGTARSDAAEALTICYDISDLVAHFRHHRLPTGIQRVQLEIVSHALLDSSHRIRICCFVEGNENLVEIPTAIFEQLAMLTRLGTDNHEPAWVEAIARLFLHLATAPEYQFVQDECLVNVGTSWWIYNYFLFIRNAKSRFNLRLVTMVHDLVPLFASEHCVRGVSEDYVGWLVGACRHIDHFLANSESTGRDLVRAAQQMGDATVAERLTIVPLNADFRRSGQTSPVSALATWNLRPESYALFVSTIESRKNHVLVLDVWAELLRAGDMADLPQLVFVGRNGWLNDQVFQRLEVNATLRRKVTLIERASDEDLALLYSACLMTVYPSLYEGWGLPVTESLCYGKLPVVADNSSLPEAGGDFALLFESNSVSAMAAAVRQVVENPDWRRAQEARIRAEFAPRPWSSISDQVIGVVQDLSRAGGKGWTPPEVEPARYYPVARYRGVRVWKGLEAGEMFRFGEGWHWPNEAGARTRAAGGELQFTLPAGEGPWRLYLRLFGLNGEECPYEIRVGDELLAAGSLVPRECRWARGASFNAEGGQTVTVHVRGLVSEHVDLVEGGGFKSRMASIGVAGFYLFSAADQDAYHQLLEANVLNRLDEINAYKEC